MKLYLTICTFVTCGRVAHKTSRQFVGKWIVTHYKNNHGQLVLHFHFSFMRNCTSTQIAQKSVSKSIQNECAADTACGVQQGLGVFTQQAKFVKIARREIVKVGNRSASHCLPICECPYYSSKSFPTWTFLRNNFVLNWRKVLTSIIYFIPIWDEVKTLRLITFRQVVGKFQFKIK